MSILIKGMDLPKDCDALVLVRVDGSAIVYADNAYMTTAVPVPTPHGRLIDADALEDEGADVHEDIMCCGYVEDAIWGFSHDMIRNAPTIIKAEGE